MIRINLLPHREMRRERRKKEFVALSLFTVLGAAGIALLVALGIHGQIDSQQARNAFITAENAKLDEQIKEIALLRQEIEALKARQYAVEREAFGQPIGAFQGTGFKIADMKTRIEASRLLIYNAALAKIKSKETGGRYSLEASMAKLFASETPMYVTHQAVQIHGGMGYSRELPIERYFRDAKITEIYEGTSEIQRLVISRSEMGLK